MVSTIMSRFCARRSACGILAERRGADGRWRYHEKVATGICGALLTNVSAWLSGIWFDLNLVGGLFKDIAYLLPFVHAVEMSKDALNGQVENMLPHMWWVLVYAIVIGILSIYVFKIKTKEA